jgi:isochorismate pyruvate lyase
MTPAKAAPLSPDQQRALLAPYRARLDALDTQIVELLGKRFDVVREVAALKAENGIAPILPDRIEEVVARARAKAVEEGVDPKLVEQIYRTIIDAACRLETDYAHDQAAKAQ